MVNAASLLAICNTTNPFPISPGFDIASVVPYLYTLPVQVWSLGETAEALLELHNPALSVFGASPFPVPTVSVGSVEALQYAVNKTVFGAVPDGFGNGLGSTADAVGLGVSAVLIGKTNATYAAKVVEEVDYITTAAPLFSNGAISQRVASPSLWADFIYMGPPFLSYVGADQKNLSLIQTAYEQCGLYREILKTPSGAWEHIVGGVPSDAGVWATGNGFAAFGMVRVLATLTKAPVAALASWRGQAITDLTHWIQEIVDAAIASPTDSSGLIGNYFNNTTPIGFGEVTGSALITAAAYRMAVLQPKTFGKKYIAWADKMRAAMAKHVSSAGIAAPAINPMNWTDPTPVTTGSPEGQIFTVLMYTGWRDCVLAGVCPN